MSESTATNPELLADQVSSVLTQPLEAASVVLSSGPRIFDTSGVLRLKKLTGSSAVGFVGEGEEIDDSHSTEFDELVLMPTERKSIKVIERYTNELVRQSVLGLDAVLKSRLVKVVSDKLDTALLVGNGATNSIRGIFYQPGIQTASFSVHDYQSADTLLDAIGLANAAEVTPNRWFFSGADFIALRKLKDDMGRYLLESDLTRDATYRLFGIPVTITNKLWPGAALLVDMNEVAIARDLAPSVTILNERYAEFDEKGIRVVTRYDLGLLHPEGVVRLTYGSGS